MTDKLTPEQHERILDAFEWDCSHYQWYETYERALIKILNANTAEPCINCGQKEGDVFEGQPHDHVCPKREALSRE